MTDEMRKFLTRLDERGGVVRPREIGLFLSNAQDRARKACRFEGLARYMQDESDPDGRLAWHITPAGRAALQSAAHPRPGR